MHTFRKGAIAGAVALAIAQTATAGTAPFFIPLTKPEIVEPADSVDERNAPWSAPAGVSFKNLTSMEEVESGAGSILRVPAGNVSSMFDMLAYDPSGDYIFIPHETPIGAGVSRYHVPSDTSEILFMGDQSGAPGFLADTDFGAFDPSRWTPNGTVLAGEEWAGSGRLIELCHPLGPAPTNPVAGGGELNKGNCDTDPSADWRVMDNLPLSAWEGISFSVDAPQEVMYFVDEDRSGSIYKTVFTTPGKYNDGGVTYVLSVNDFASTGGDATARWDRAPNTDAGVSRTGAATWIPITDATGAPLPGIQDPREVLLDADGNIIDQGEAGRIAADNVEGTPYGRPEDATTTKLANGNEVLYWAATSENSVYGLEETAGPKGTTAIVRALVTPATPKNAGFEPTSAVLNAPDNLAIDSLGNIYIIEDSPNTTTVGADGGDIWFVQDMDNDGEAEAIHQFLSLQVNQSEATGMIFHPQDPTRFVVVVQHPASTALGDVSGAFDDMGNPIGDGVRDLDELGNPVAGFGDAIWEFNLSNVAPPKCVGSRRDWMTFNPLTRRWVRACSTQRDYNVVDQLIDSEDGDFPTP